MSGDEFAKHGSLSGGLPPVKPVPARYPPSAPRDRPRVTERSGMSEPQTGAPPIASPDMYGSYLSLAASIAVLDDGFRLEVMTDDKGVQHKVVKAEHIKIVESRESVSRQLVDTCKFPDDAVAFHKLYCLNKLLQSLKPFITVKELQQQARK